jgi:hypothetical protein
MLAAAPTGSSSADAAGSLARRRWTGTGFPRHDDALVTKHDEVDVALSCALQDDLGHVMRQNLLIALKLASECADWIHL